MLNSPLQAPNMLNLETKKVDKLARAQQVVWEGPVDRWEEGSRAVCAAAS